MQRSRHILLLIAVTVPDPEVRLHARMRASATGTTFSEGLFSEQVLDLRQSVSIWGGAVRAQALFKTCHRGKIHGKGDTLLNENLRRFEEFDSETDEFRTLEERRLQMSWPLSRGTCFENQS